MRIGDLFAMSVHLDADGRVSDRTFHSGEIPMSQISENGERKQQAIHDLKDARAAIAMGAGVGNAVKDFLSRKRAVFRSRSRETSEAFHGKCPNSHESGYKNPLRRCGVGTIGTASAILLGATCPICVVMAPALIGIGQHDDA